MRLCHLCGQSLEFAVESAQRLGLCAYHSGYEEDWAEQNRIICNWLHRGVPLPRVKEPDPESWVMLGLEEEPVVP